MSRRAPLATRFFLRRLVTGLATVVYEGACVVRLLRRERRLLRREPRILHRIRTARHTTRRRQRWRRPARLIIGRLRHPRINLAVIQAAIYEDAGILLMLGMSSRPAAGQVIVGNREYQCRIARERS